MKNLANLVGVKKLTKFQQKSINGGWGCPGSCATNLDCIPCSLTAFEEVYYICYNNFCQEL